MSSFRAAAHRLLCSISFLMLSAGVARAQEGDPMADWYCYNGFCCKWIDPNGTIGGVDYTVFVQESCTECPGTSNGWQGTLGVRPGACD